MRVSTRIAFFLLFILSTRSLLWAQVDSTQANRWYLEAQKKAGDSHLSEALSYLDSASMEYSKGGYFSRVIAVQLIKCKYLREQRTQYGEIAETINRCESLLPSIEDPVQRSSYASQLFELNLSMADTDSMKLVQIERQIELISKDSSLFKLLAYQVYQQKGIYFYETDQFDSCNFYQELALQAMPGGNNLEVEGDLYLQWAKSLRRMGDLQKAINLNKQAINAYTQVLGSNDTKVATGYNDLAIVQNLIGQTEESGNNFSTALKIRERLFGRHTNEYASVLNNATLYYLELGRLDRALRYARETISIFESIKNPDQRFQVASYNTLAKVYTSMGDLNLAKINFQKAVDLHQRYFPDNSRIRFYYLDLGRNAMQRKKYDEAIIYFHQAMSAAIPGIDPSDVYQNPAKQDPSNYLSLKTLCLLKAQAFHQLYQQDLDTATLSQALSLYELADYYATKNRTEVQYQKSRMAFSRQNITLYEGAILANLQMWKETENPFFFNRAFVLSEKSKSLTLLEDLLEANALKTSNLPLEILSREKELQDSISHYRSQLINDLIKKDSVNRDAHQIKILELDLKFEDFKKDIEKEYPEFYRTKYDLNFLSPATVRGKLKENESLVEYFVGQENIFVFIINDHISNGYIVPKPDSFEVWITGLLHHLETYDFSQPQQDSLNAFKIRRYCEYSYTLYNLIWRPFLTEVKEKVTIIPDAALNYLPFGVLLPDPYDSGTDLRDFQYLESRYTVSYNYSATLGQEMVGSALVEKDEFLVVAPEFGENSDTSMGTLLFNTDEAKEIAEILGGDLLIGDGALKRDFKNRYADYGAFHFATHAIINEDDADLSFLAFQGATEDSRLYLQELYTIKIPANIVTLSACETNVGPLLQGEGLASLAKGFSYAGAKSIITSMWDVDDRSTRKIMTGFYGHLVQGKNKDAALQAAKSDYLKTAGGAFAHPYFWAGFIAIGDMSPLEITKSSHGLLYAGLLLSLMILSLIIYYKLK
ncbi:MAG: CHAT domain-containing protein [Saprospiraceae bacterium]|nr:CHAT domain-containing protein [Saprospiraceae bacterium]